MVGRIPDTVSAYPTGAINGFQIAYASATTLTVASGSSRDSTDSCNMAVSTASTTINAATAGVVNGIDTGSLANSTQYSIFVIGDSTGKNATGFLVSAASTPTLPSGYDIYRLIGYWFTNSSAQFWLGYYFGSGSYRKFQYDSAQSVLSAGSATSYTAVDLSAFVPSISATTYNPVQLLVQFTPNAAADKASLRPTGATSGTPFDITGVVATKAQDVPVTLLTGFASAKAEVDYKVAASGALTIQVLGFEVSL